MNPETLIKLFKVSHSSIKENIKGVTHIESLVQPNSDGNYLNWVLGHIVCTRNIILKLLGETPIWSKEEAEFYKRYSESLKKADNAHPFKKIIADFDRSQKQIMNALNLKYSPIIYFFPIIKVY